jgi:hypothetical protein
VPIGRHRAGAAAGALVDAETDGAGIGTFFDRQAVPAASTASAPMARAKGESPVRTSDIGPELLACRAPRKSQDGRLPAVPK